jgi:hypothetical protein
MPREEIPADFSSRTADLRAVFALAADRERWAAYSAPPPP